MDRKIVESHLINGGRLTFDQVSDDNHPEIESLLFQLSFRYGGELLSKVFAFSDVRAGDILQFEGDDTWFLDFFWSLLSPVTDDPSERKVLRRVEEIVPFFFNWLRETLSWGIRVRFSLDRKWCTSGCVMIEFEKPCIGLSEEVLKSTCYITTSCCAPCAQGDNDTVKRHLVSQTLRFIDQSFQKELNILSG